MGYTKELSYKDTEVVFEYNTNGEMLFLEEVNADFTCPVEEKYVMLKIQEWLDDEWTKNGIRYIQDYLIYRMEKRYGTR